MNISTMTGIEFLQAMVEGEIPHPSITQTIPMKVERVEKGFARFHAKVDNRHLNPIGGVHGGFAATLLDSVTGCAIHSTLEADVSYATIDLAVKIFRPLPLDTELIAEGRVINLSKNIGASEGQITDANGKLYAHATCSCSIIRPKKD